MKDIVYLIMNKRGVVGTRKGQPALKSGEVAVRMQVEVPDEVFKLAIPTVNLKIDEKNLRLPDPQIKLLDPGKLMP